jgi:hypothetical protein
MGNHYDWNVEVIAQFYATLYIKEGGAARRMHWMTKGDWFNISYNDFASRFSFGTADARRQRLHIQNSLDEEEIKFMYAPRLEGNAGTTNGLYTFYSVLNMLFRKTVCPRDGDPTNISQFAKNLLANMRDGAPPLSVMDFVWEEIKGISLNPQKTGCDNRSDRCVCYFLPNSFSCVPSHVICITYPYMALSHLLHPTN